MSLSHFVIALLVRLSRTSDLETVLIANNVAVRYGCTKMIGPRIRLQRGHLPGASAVLLRHLG